MKSYPKYKDSFTMFGEASSAEIAGNTDAKGFQENKKAAEEWVKADFRRVQKGDRKVKIKELKAFGSLRSETL